MPAQPGSSHLSYEIAKQYRYRW